MSMDAFETRLTRVLRADAERAVVRIDAAAIADAAVLAPVRSGRRRPWLLPAFAAVLLGTSMVGGALLLGSAPDRADSGPIPITPDRADTGPTPLTPDATTAILLRSAPEPWGSVEVVALRSTGDEQVLRTLTPADLADGGWFSPFGHVSEHGALAVHVERNRFALLSLTDVDRPMAVIPYRPVVGGRWSPTDVFATISTAPGTWAMQAVDLDGTVREFGPVILPGGGPDIIWAADGSGLLTPIEQGQSPSGVPFARYAIARVDDTPALPGVPELSFSAGSRYVAVGGRTLDLCLGDCGQRSTPSVWVSEPTDDGFGGGEVMPEPGDVPGTLADASFAADDRSIWMLFDRTTGDAREAILARQLELGGLSIVATVPIDPATTYLWFDSFAADDSLIGIGHWITGGEDRLVTIVDPATGVAVTTGDTVIGYVTDPRPSVP